jgi:hypothetical protein
MKRIPHAREVAKAMRTLKASVRTAWKGVNKSAGKLIAKGNYAAGEQLATRGRKVKEFLGSVDALDREWRSLAKGAAASAGSLASDRLPQWEYYQPILQALVEAGGQSRRVKLEPLVQRRMADRLTAAEREPMSAGRERWQVMIRRARKHLAAEGWIEPGTSAEWRITADGRRAAQSVTTAGGKGGDR